MSKKNYETIGIRPETKLLFDKQKKGMSADEYLSQMLTYFVATNIDPSGWKNNPTDGIMKAITQLKEMIRAVERDKINKILEYTKSSQESIGTSRQTTDEISIEQLRQVINENNQLNENLKASEAANDKLRIANEKLKVELNLKIKAESPVNKEAILECLDIVLSKLRRNRLQEGVVSIQRIDIENYFNRIRKELSN